MSVFCEGKLHMIKIKPIIITSYLFSHDQTHEDEFWKDTKICNDSWETFPFFRQCMSVFNNIIIGFM